jgi:protein-S-isoprenylcysteine O-methyltransferase Ste14
MTIAPDGPAAAASFVVALGWLGFAVILLVGHRGASKSEIRRDPKSALGFLLQCAGYAICFVFARTYFSPWMPMSRTSETIVAAFTALLATVSVWFCYSAAKMLGKQWALAARVIEGHELIFRGPFAIVRHPIYLAMFGMLLATALAVGCPWVLPVAILVFLIGTAIRIRTEENLLRQNFGSAFDDYARRVPAFVPRLPR